MNSRRELQEPRVLIIAHRGFSAAEPENTLAAFRRALDVGATHIELDYHHSADDVPVVLHDDELFHCTNSEVRFPNGPRLVAKATLSELRQLNAAARFPAHRPEPIPTLDEALNVISPRAIPVIERKAGDAQTLLELLQRKMLTERVVVMAFDWDFLQECRRLEPRLQCVALGDGPIEPADLGLALRCQPNRLGWNHQNLNAESIAHLAQTGRPIWSYTVNDLDRARELVELGVQGIISNHPDTMIAGLLRQV